MGRELLEPLSNEDIAAFIEELGTDDARYLLEMLPEERRDEVIGLMDAKETEVLQDMTAYPPETAGSIMTDSYVALSENNTVEEAIAHVRRATEEVEYIFYVYAVDDERNLRGVISLRQLLLARPTQKLSQVMTPNVWRVNVLADQEHVAQLISLLYGLAKLQYPSIAPLGIILGLAISISIIISATLSSLLLFMLHFLRLDPALMTGPFVTTCMDLVSVLVYFNIARIFPTMTG